MDVPAHFPGWTMERKPKHKSKFHSNNNFIIIFSCVKFTLYLTFSFVVAIAGVENGSERRKRKTRSIGNAHVSIAYPHGGGGGGCYYVIVTICEAWTTSPSTVAPSMTEAKWYHLTVITIIVICIIIIIQLLRLLLVEGVCVMQTRERKSFIGILLCRRCLLLFAPIALTPESDRPSHSGTIDTVLLHESPFAEHLSKRRRRRRVNLIDS